MANWQCQGKAERCGEGYGGYPQAAEVREENRRERRRMRGCGRLGRRGRRGEERESDGIGKEARGQEKSALKS